MTKLAKQRSIRFDADIMTVVSDEHLDLSDLCRTLVRQYLVEKRFLPAQREAPKQTTTDETG